MKRRGSDSFGLVDSLVWRQPPSAVRPGMALPDFAAFGEPPSSCARLDSRGRLSPHDLYLYFGCVGENR
jgi:hypothetical protein